MTTIDSVVFCTVIEGNGRGADIDAPYDSGEKPAWTHLDFKASDARQWLQGRGIDEQAVDTLVAQESRPRVVSHDGGLLTVLRGINRNAGEDPEDMVSIRIWLTETAIITVRQRKVRAAAEVHELLLAGKGPVSAAETMVMIVDRLAAGAGDFIDKLEDRVGEYEETFDAQETSRARSELAETRREVAMIRRYIAPQRAALETLSRQGARWFSNDQLYLLRELADQFLRYVEDLDLLRERTLVLQEELMNRISQEQNTRTYLFTVVATIFLPITFISGLFGMNTAGLPGLEDSNAFWIVSGVMALIAIGVFVWLRFKKWF